MVASVTRDMQKHGPLKAYFHPIWTGIISCSIKINILSDLKTVGLIYEFHSVVKSELASRLISKYIEKVRYLVNRLSTEKILVNSYNPVSIFSCDFKNIFLLISNLISIIIATHT